MLIGLTYDLKDDYRALGLSEAEVAEFDSRETIAALSEALTSLGHRCIEIGHVKALAQRLVSGERWDLVFNIAEGASGFGRESQVPALLEAYGLPYTFSDPLVCALTLHKAMAKHVARGCGVPTPDFVLVSSAAEAAAIELPLPLFVKPVAEGTSKGITGASLVKSREALRRVSAELLREFKQPVLVERYLSGREFTVGILGTGSETRALATLAPSIRGDEAEVYSYRNKLEWRDYVEYRLLESGTLRAEVEAVAVAAWKSLGCRDAGRVDVRLDDHGQPQMLEINPLAGLTPGHSDLPLMAELAGLGYRDLIAAILACACRRLSIDAAATGR